MLCIFLDKLQKNGMRDKQVFILENDFDKTVFTKFHLKEIFDSSSIC